MSRRRFPDDFQEQDGLWTPVEEDRLTSYSDGDRVERRLAEILESETDRSAESADLVARIDDWPTRYYLSPERANLFRALNLRPDAAVLELGCGCGAVTRWLGENTAHVTAVEGSRRRASIARLRCADLDSVRVIAGDFTDLEWDRKFDVVTLIGVLEYAAIHLPDSADPFGEVLAAARRALAPGGVLIVAIENAVGIKYLAGCGEDHGLRPYAGIEGYPDSSGPQTFGREDLQRRIEAAGLPAIQCLLPFPDYKIPGVVLNGERATADECNALSLTDWCRHAFDQYDGERDHAFSDHLALRQFAENGMLPDVANSFLMLASERTRGEESPVPPIDWIARKINVHRRPPLRTSVTLLREEGTAVLRKEPLHKTLVHESQACFDHRPLTVTPYLERSPTLAMRMLQGLRQQQPVQAFTLCLEAWVEFLQRSSDDELTSGTVDGSFLDCTPDNLLIREGEGLVYVDDEWRWHDPVPVDWLLYRGLLSFWYAHHPWVREVLPVQDADSLFRHSLTLLGLKVSRRRQRELRGMEVHFQQQVTGRRPAHKGNEKGAGRPKIDGSATAQRILRDFRPEGLRIAGAAPAALLEALQTANIPFRTESDGNWNGDLGIWYSGADADAPGPDVFPEDLASCRQWIVCPGESSSGEPNSGGLELPNFQQDERADVGFVAPRARLYRQESLRITILSPSTELHGGTMVLVQHAQELAARGHRVWIASPSANAPDWADLGDGVSYIHLPERLSDWEHALPDADALVATLWTTAPVVRTADASKGKKFYLIQAYESAWAGEPDDVDATYRLGLNSLCVSSWLKELLLETYGVAADLVPNGTDFAGRPVILEADQTGRAKGAPLRIGMLCHLAAVKGTADGLHAFAKVQRQLGDRVELVLYGTERPSGIDDSIEFHVRPSREALAEMLASLDVFVSPSLSEGFGLPALEAMAMGTATVLTDSGGCRDYARKGAVLLSPPGDSDALAANLLKVCREPGLRRSLAAEGKQVADKFSWPASSSLLEQSFSRAIETPADPMHVIYVAAGPCWFDTYLDPWMLRAFRELGHQVTEFHPRPLDARYRSQFVNPALLDAGRRRQLAEGSGQLPTALPDFVRKHRPDLVFINHGLLIPPAVLDDLRRLGVPTAAWMMDEPQEVYYSSNRGRLVDYVFLQDRGSLARHRGNGNPRTFLLPHGVDPIDHRRRDDGSGRAEFASDLLLVGTGFPARVELIRQLAGLDCDIQVIGRGWDGIDLSNVRVRNTPVTAEDAGHYYRGAKMTLNLHRGRNDMASGTDIPHPMSPNGSFFHISGCESLQLVDEDYPGATEYLVPGRQFATFRDTAELHDRVGYFLDHESERRKLAEDAAWSLHRHHSYADQLRRALDAMGTPQSHRRLYGLTQSAAADRDVFDRAAAVPLVSVLLHVEGGEEAVQRALLGVAAGHSEPYEIIVYHDGDRGLEQWLDKRNIRHVGISGCGPAEAIADARARADGELLIYVQDSALVTTHMFQRLSTLFSEDDSIGLLAPAIHPAGGDQGIDAAYSSLGELGRVSRDLLLSHRGDFQDHPAPSAICFAVRRSALEQAGGFDRRIPAGTLELADLCRRIRGAGWKTGWTRSTLVHRLAPPPVPTDEALAEARRILDAKQQDRSVEIPTLSPAQASNR